MDFFEGIHVSIIVRVPSILCRWSHMYVHGDVQEVGRYRTLEKEMALCAEIDLVGIYRCLDCLA